jgi:S-adenosylmethionine decarboxylase
MHGMPQSDHKDFALGKHMTVEFYYCDSKFLADSKKMEKAFLKAARASNATVLGSTFHSFEPQGISGFVIIAESHFSVHSWPEYDYAAVDIFTCGDNISFEKAVNSLTKSMKAGGAVISNLMNRGIVSNNGVEKLVPVCENRTHLYALSWEKRFKESKAWGLTASVDVYGCDHAAISDAAIIKEFAGKLCKEVKMKPFGECNVVHFGKNKRLAGFSMTQLIETSLISGHFAFATDAAYLDIFSCKFFEPRAVAEFAMEFFKGNHYRMQVGLRR